jgi:hypothetical protein
MLKDGKMVERLKVYVAGASREIERAKRMMAAVQHHGMVVAYDWPARIEEAGSANEGLTAAVSKAASLEALGGVASSHVFWFLLPNDTTIGAYVELGYFLGIGKGIAIGSGGAHGVSIFTATFHVTFDTDEQALEWLAGKWEDIVGTVRP